MIAIALLVHHIGKDQNTGLSVGSMRLAHQAMPDEAGRVRRRHAHYYVQMLHTQEEALLSAAQRAVLDAIALEISNIRQAWQWVVAQADVAAIARAEHTLAKYYQFRGFYQEGTTMLARALPCLRGAAGSQAADMALAGLLVDTALLHIRLGRTQEAHAALEESQALYERHNLPPRPGCSTDPRIGLSELALYAGAYAEAIRLALAVLHTSEAHGHQINLLDTRYTLVGLFITSL